GGGDAGKLADGADVGVGLEELAQGDVGRLLAVADGRAEGAFEDDARLADALDGLLRHSGGDALFEDTLAGLADLPGDLGARRLDDAAGAVGAFGADAVAGDEGDEFLAVGGGEHGRTGSCTG